MHNDHIGMVTLSGFIQAVAFEQLLDLPSIVLIDLAAENDDQICF